MCSRHRNWDSLAAPGGLQGSWDPPTALGRDHLEAGGCLNKAVTPWEVYAGPGSWQDLWLWGERSPSWSRFTGRIWIIFHWQTWIWLEISNFSKSCLFGSWQLLLSDLPLPFSWPMSLLFYVLFPAQLGREWQSVFGGHLIFTQGQLTTLNYCSCSIDSFISII